jgi:hypothetical protein
MKKSIFGKFFKKLAPIALTALLTVACGRDNNTSSSGVGVGGIGGLGGIGGFGGAPIAGNMTIQSIFQQIPCQSSMGPNAFNVFSYQNVNGSTQPFTANINNGFGVTNTYFGVSQFGDVAMITQSGGVSQIVIKYCSRAFVTMPQVVNMQTQNIRTNVSRACAVNEISTGIVNLTFAGGQQVAMSLYPMHMHNPRPSICSGMGY